LACEKNSLTTANYALNGSCGLAATTLPLAGLLVSTFDFVDLLLVVGAVFLPARDFFSIAIFGFSSIDLTALRTTLVQADDQTKLRTRQSSKPPKTTVRQGDRVRAAFPVARKGLIINPCGLII
jgi:hypothetical protein